MKQSYSRRQFIKKSAISAVGLGVVSTIPLFGQTLLAHGTQVQINKDVINKLSFVPTHAASWWCELEDC